MGMPLMLSIIFIPLLLRGYGNERFGIITILWVVIGYMGIFDLGLGRALTKYVTEHKKTRLHKEEGHVVYTINFCLFILGVLVALVLYLLSEQIAFGLVKNTDKFYSEVILAIKILCIAIPFAIYSSGLVGVLEGVGEFKAINSIRLFSGALNFIGPYALLFYGEEVYYGVFSMAIVRIASTALLQAKLSKYYSFCIDYVVFDFQKVRAVFHFGAWITVSNILAPLLSQLDKFLLAGALSVSILAYYSIPSDVVNKLFFIPSALMSVLFPIFSKFEVENAKEASPILKTASNAIFYSAIPCCYMFYIFGGDILELWLGSEFRIKSEEILKVLAIGFLFNCMARVPHAFIQAIGKAKSAAIINFLELPVFTVLLILLVNKYSVLGAAIAWTLRMALDFVVLAIYINSVSGNIYKPLTYITSAMCVYMFMVGVLGLGLLVNILFAVLFFGWAGYMFIKTLKEMG